MQCAAICRQNASENRQDDGGGETLVYAAGMVGVGVIDIFDKAQRYGDGRAWTACMTRAVKRRRDRVADLARMGVMRLEAHKPLDEGHVDLGDEHGGANPQALPAPSSEPAQFRLFRHDAYVEGDLNQWRSGVELGDHEALRGREERRSRAEAKRVPGIHSPGQRARFGTRPVEPYDAHRAGSPEKLLVGPAGFEPATTPL